MTPRARGGRVRSRRQAAWLRRYDGSERRRRCFLSDPRRSGAPRLPRLTRPVQRHPYLQNATEVPRFEIGYSQPWRAERQRRRGLVMNFGFSEEQDELRKMVRRFLEEKSPETEVRRLMATPEGLRPPRSGARWPMNSRSRASAFPRSLGGQGFGPVELYVVFEEMGAALLCSPYFSSVALAANALLLVGSDEDKRTICPQLHRATLSLPWPLLMTPASGTLTKTSTTAVGSGKDFVLNGVRSFVTDGSTASLLLVPAVTAKGLSLFAVEGTAAGLTRETLSTMDPDAQAEPTGAEGHARDVGWTGGRRTGEVERNVANRGGGRSPPNRLVARSACLTRRWNTPRLACSSDVPLVRFRPLSTSVPICCSTSSRPSRPRITRPGAAQERNDELPIAASLAKSFLF